MMLVVDLLIRASVITIGFTTHHASLCNVRAVAEVMYTKKVQMLRSFAKSMFWATLVAGTSVLWLDMPQPTVLARTPAGFAVLGGLTFGIGAAIIGIAGCILYALQGAWSFTNFLRTAVESAFGAETATTWHALLMRAVLAGMIGSSIQRLSFAIQIATLSLV